MSHRKGRIALCLRCRNLKKYEARGLCKCCYNHVRENRVAGQTLDDYPLLTTRKEDLLSHASRP